MAALLPVVEKVNSHRVAERLWLAASCRADRLQEPSSEAVLSNAILAMRVSRFDRAMADVLAAPVFKRLPILLDGTDGWGFHDDRVFRVLAAYDSRAIPRLLLTLPAAARRTEHDLNGNLKVAPDAHHRLAAARMLGMPIGARSRAATANIYGAASELPAE